MSTQEQQHRERLAAPFPEEQVRVREGRAGMKLRWVEARAVAQRLNEVIGVGMWSFEVSTVEGHPTVVKGRLSLPGGIYEDYGYETGGSGETLKEASSDALRRCASLVGVAAYLYTHTEGTGAVAASRPTPAPAPRVHPSSDARPAPAPLTDDQQVALAAARIFAEGECPEHRIAWVHKPAGVSKAGKAYSAFWTCTGKTDGQFCKQKPSIAWINAQRQPAPAAAAPASSAGQPLEDLPF